MIYHYINLVAWNEVNSSYSSSRDVFFCDSVSLLLLAKLFGYAPNLTPGPSIALKVDSLSNSDSALFLVKDKSCFARYKKALDLPLFESKVFLNDATINCLQSNNFETIFIGISTPKQNYLAQEIYKRYNDVEIHCIGAALDGKKTYQSPSKLNKTGFQWVLFLAKSPKRTVKKLLSTFAAIGEILFSKKKRHEFFIFCERLESK